MSGQDTDYRELLLQFIGSLTICDHIGDVTNEIDDVLTRLGMPLPAEVATDTDWGIALGEWLGKQGITDMHGEPLYEPEEKPGEPSPPHSLHSPWCADG